MEWYFPVNSVDFYLHPYELVFMCTNKGKDMYSDANKCEIKIVQHDCNVPDMSGQHL